MLRCDTTCGPLRDSRQFEVHTQVKTRLMRCHLNGGGKQVLWSGLACLPSNFLESRSGRNAISYLSTHKYRADGSSRYLLPGCTQQTDHLIISVPASTEQMGRLGIWYLEVRSRRIIPSFHYPKVPSRWVVLISGTSEYRTDGSFHHFSTGKYQADGSSRYLVPVSTEQMDRFGFWCLQAPSIISSMRP